MKRLTTIAALLAAWCAVASPGAGHTTPPQDVLASYDWSVTVTPNLATNPPPKEVIEAFIAKGLYFRPGRKPSVQLCSFTFADLRHNGNLSLVASYDDGPRMFCNSILIIDKTTSEFQVWELNVSRGVAADNISSLIKDLAGDGKLELVIPTDLTGFSGGWRCVAIWPVVYAWTGSGYANVSDRFTRFYQDQLDILKKKISGLPASPTGTIQSPSGPVFADRNCTEAEAAKIQRFLGRSPNAGLSQAAALAASADPDDRSFALDILRDINTPEALRYVKMLSSDRVSYIAGDARSELANQIQSTPPQPLQFPSVPFATAPSAGAEAGTRRLH